MSPSLQLCARLYLAFVVTFASFTSTTALAWTSPPAAPIAGVTPAATGTVPVDIATDTTLTNDRVWHVPNSVRVKVGVTLTVEPGTTLRFGSGAFLLVEGALVADAQGGDPILLTADSEDPQPASWGGAYSTGSAGIFFLVSSVPATLDGSGAYVSGSIIRNAVVEYGMGIACEGGAPLIESSTIRYHGNYGRGVVSALTHASNALGDPAPVIRNNNITDNAVVALQLNRDGTVVSGNVIARNAGAILAQRSAKVVNNLITLNGNLSLPYVYGLLPAAIYADQLDFHGNTMLANPAEVDFRYAGAEPTTLDISGNYWGTTSAAEIESRVYHAADAFTLGTLIYSPFLTEAAPAAPAHVAAVTVEPGATIGPGQARFTVQFSGPMDQASAPTVSFRRSDGGTWQEFNRENSGLPANDISDVQIAPDGSIWFATYGGGVARFDGVKWVTYNTHNSGLGENYVNAIGIAGNDDVWFSHPGRNGVVVSHYQAGEWQAYARNEEACRALYIPWLDDIYRFGTVPEQIDGLCDAYDIAIDGAGSVYFGTLGVMQYDGSQWTLHGEDSGLPDDWVEVLASAADGSLWVGFDDTGLARFDGSAWSTYDLANSELLSLRVSSLATGRDGSVWIANSGSGLTHYDGSNWTAYPSSDRSGYREGPPDYSYGLAVGPGQTLWAASYQGLVRFDGSDWTYYDAPGSASMNAISADEFGSLWIGTSNRGVLMRLSDQEFEVADDGRWLDDRTWQATFDVSTLISRGEYDIIVRGGRSQNGLDVPMDSRASFTVAYPGTITDTSAPPAPNAYASGLASDPTAVYARWSAADADSTIDMFRYALGSTRGGSDVIAWTQTTATDLKQSGLALIPGNRYWLAVRARNNAGLWSEAREVSFLAGQVWPGDVYLPIANR